MTSFLSVSATNIKTIKSAVDSVLTEKTKLEKNKKKPAAKAKGGVRMERDVIITFQIFTQKI